MKTTITHITKSALVLMLLFCLSALQMAMAAEGNVSDADKWAWSENAGWINIRPTAGGVTVHDTYLSGYAWAENIGWISLGSAGGGPYVNTTATDWGVHYDGFGNLSGYAWSETAGWINFNPSNSQVTIDLGTGYFDGYAWSENIGWIHFKNADPAYNVVAILPDTDGDGLSDALEGTTCTDPNDADTDNDGILDGWEDVNHNGVVDAGETDPCNIDTDNDGIQDGTEPGYTLENIGPDTDTLIFQPDLDPETTTDPLNPDTDGDGWDDGEEDINYNGLIDSDETNPNDNTSPVATPPEVRESIPHHNAGIEDDTRVPNNSSFAVRIEDSDGIDITDTSSIKFTVNDGDNPVYERELADTSVVRVIKLIPDPDTEVTYLWAVYDRSVDVYGNFSYGANINIKVGVRDRRDDAMAQKSYDFRIESEEAHNQAQANLPDTSNVDPDDPALVPPYTEGSRINSGDLTGAKIIYDSSEPVTPIIGPENELPELDTAEEAVGVPMNLQPPTVFNTPVKIFIPCTDNVDVSGLSVYLYKGADWVLACDAAGNVQSGGDGWMVPGSRVNHNNGDPSTIEIQVYHFSGVQSGATTGGGVTPSGGGNGGCFIATAAYGSQVEPHVKILREFRDRFMLNNPAGKAFVRLYYTCSPSVANFIAGHDDLRAVVQLSLLPIVGVSWVALYLGHVGTLVFMLLILILISATAVVLFNRRHLQPPPLF